MASKIIKLFIIYFIMTNKIPDYQVGFEVLKLVVTKTSIFWDVMTCSPLKIMSHLAHSSTLKMEAARSSRTSADFQRTI
jgi:hypothetical protein